MRETVRGKIVLVAVLAIAAGAFGAGFNWGLPSKSVDSYFFSVDSKVMTDSRQAYLLSGTGIAHLAGDTDQIIDRSKTATILENGNGTVSQDAVNRAKILRTWRLDSCDPDERATLDALISLNPEKGQYDPKIYRYGGMWFYPLWGLAKVASAMNWVKLSSDTGFYVDHPEEAARIYMLTRGYSAFWGLVAVAAFFGLMRKLTAGVVMSALASIGFIAMPVVLTAAHEGTPQLAGAALTMMAVLAAMRYLEDGKSHWVLLAAAGCGMAAGMSVASAVAILVIPMMALAAGGGKACMARDMSLGIIVAVVIYLAADPAVAIHLMAPGQWDALGWNMNGFHKNLPIGSVIDSGTDAAKLVAESMSWPLAAAGVIGVLILPLSFKSTDKDWREEFSVEAMKASRLSDVAGMLWALGLLALLQFVVFAASRPASYSRTGIFAETVLLISAITTLERFMRQWLAIFATLLLVGAAGVFGWSYYQGYIKDASPDNTRSRTAIILNQTRQSMGQGQTPTLAVAGYPQPSDMPPVDLMAWKIIVLPRSETAADSHESADVFVGPASQFHFLDRSATPLSWASRTYCVRQNSGGKTLSQFVGP